jgi:hypothetical protein
MQSIVLLLLLQMPTSMNCVDSDEPQSLRVPLSRGDDDIRLFPRRIAGLEGGSCECV